MKALRTFWTPCAVIALALIASPAVCGQERGAAGASSFRADFDKVLAHYQGVFRNLSHARGLQQITAARVGLRAMSDDQIAGLFEKGDVPDMSVAVEAAAKLEASTPALGSRTSRTADTPGFPNAPPILDDCDNIAHSSQFTLDALIAWQVLRAVFVTTEHICQQVVVAAGAGGNTSTACIIPGIAVDAAAIPFELADLCGGEEDSAIGQGSYDRLEHLHGDIAEAKAAIIANDNTNRDLIIANDNANRDIILTAMKNLSCDIERLLHTPEGQRRSDISECKGQPFFPYDFPLHP